MSNELRSSEIQAAMDKLNKAHREWWNMELSKLYPARDAGEAITLIVKHNPGLTSSRKIAAALPDFKDSQGNRGPKVSRETVQDYMKVFEKWPEIEALLAKLGGKQIGY